MNDIKIKVKKSEVEYCFKADNYDEFHRRFNQLADIMYQRFINELTIEPLKEVVKMADYISREAVLQKFLERGSGYINELTMRDIINEISAADVQPVKRGKWVQIGEQSAKCTECGGVLKSNGIDKTGKALIFNAVYHYCPYCGARMDGDDENES